MDTTLNNNNLTDIIQKYDKLTYFDQYGGSVVLFIIITIIVVLLISYFHTIINVQPVIDDWTNQRCKPTIIPFAGLITRPEGVSASDYTYQNFNYCTQNILAGVTATALEPLTFITNSLSSITNNIKTDIQSNRGMFDKVRTSLQSVSEEIMGRLMNIMIPLMQIIISFKDLISKIQGTMTAGLFTLLGSYYTLQALMGSIAQFIISILIALAVMIAAFWAVPFTWGVAAANTVIFIAIAIPMAIILSFMSTSLHIKGYKIPKIKCFDKNTLLKMNDETHKKIIDIKVGDVLFNNNKVTAKIQVEREGSVMYILNNIIVSNSHIVKYHHHWIPVSKHPNAIKYETYNEEYLYCLNTTNKIIEINKLIFTDWDELYDDALAKIVSNHLVFEHNIKHIHKYLDYGFAPTTIIKLKNKQAVNINQININDILENGETVYGMVEIDGMTLADQFHYCLGENKDGIDGYAPNFFKCQKTKLSTKQNKLYHLLTDKGTFIINNIIIKDYNDAIDRFL